MKREGEVVLRTTDGREIRLGAPADVRSAVREITNFWGGSSAGGVFSDLWGVLFSTRSEAEPLPPTQAAIVAREALLFQSQCGNRVSESANKLLSQLATLDGRPPRRRVRSPSGVTKGKRKRAGSMKKAD